MNDKLNKRAFLLIFICAIVYFHYTMLLRLSAEKTLKKIPAITRAPLVNISSSNASKFKTIPGPKPSIIVIAAVVCSMPGNNAPREEAAVMIKSVIISWILFRLDSRLEFHLFLEHKEDEKFFMSKIKEYGYPFTNLHLRLTFHSTDNTVPKQYEDQMLYTKSFRCMYVRCFFPSLLRNVDSVLYLDVDMIITGNISNLWSHFQTMNGEQLIGAVQDYAAQSTYKSTWFRDIPVPPPKGLNSGLLLMNLTRMREYGFEEKLLQVYKDYIRLVKMNDQKLINILLYYDKGILYELPCQYNYWLQYCVRGFRCLDAQSDVNGIQVIHGACSGFDFGKEFYDIFHHYQEINLTLSTLDLKLDLIKPIKETYSAWHNTKKNVATIPSMRHMKSCDGVLDKLLFKNIDI